MDVRPLAPADLDQVLVMLQRSLGWLPDDAHERFFAWKHRESPFGESPAWVAVDGDLVLGFRTFMRWEFADGERRLRAVRAVDTATHPEHRGRGVFSALTRHALDALRAEGVDFVFNTPNEQSLPGYLKLGWERVGRLRVQVAPAGLGGLRRLASARAPAELWSQPADVGVPAEEAFSDRESVAALLDSLDPDPGLRTGRTVEYLQWRYRFPELRYRAVAPGGDTRAGVCVLRLRRRGGALEAAVCELLVPGDRRAAAQLAGQAVRESGADYGLLLGRRLPRPRYVPAPRLGPVLTWRGVAPGASRPSMASWRLSLGDVELF